MATRVFARRALAEKRSGRQATRGPVPRTRAGRRSSSVSRVYVIVEGPSEEAFVSGPLAAHLWSSQVYTVPIVLGVPGHKGGNTSYARVEKDILRQLQQDAGSYCTMMVDYYGLGKGFPGTPAPIHLDNVRKVEHIERAVKHDICRKIPEFRPDARFIPYLSLHEYEALLFSDPDAFAKSIGQPALLAGFIEFCETFRRQRILTVAQKHIHPRE